MSVKKPQQCSEASPINGICTSSCKHRKTCKLERTTFLIHAVVINRKMKKVFKDSYINGIVHLKAKAGV